MTFVRVKEVAIVCCGVVCAFLVVGADAAPVVVQAGWSRPAQVDTALGCTTREISRERLTVAGNRDLYVEPVTMAGVNGDVFLAGTPTYLWSRAQGGRAQPDSTARVMGAVVRRNGRHTTVPAPIDPKLIIGVRAVGQGDGTWVVVFGETKSWAGNMPPDIAQRLWYGVYDGMRWRSFERIETPAGVELHPFRASELVAYGDTLTWAVRGTDYAGRTVAVVFTHRGEHWSYNQVQIIDAVDLALAHSATHGAALAVVQPDTALQQDGGSLFLYGSRPAWHRLGKLYPGDPESAIWPELSLSRSNGVLSWISLIPSASGERREARALVGSVLSTRATLLTLDSSVAEVSVPLWTNTEPYLWITDHAGANRALRQIRFVTARAGRTGVAGTIANPYTGYFGAVAQRAGGVLISGPLLESDRVVSLLIRVRVQCSARG